MSTATPSSLRFPPLLSREETPRIIEALSQLTVEDLRRISLRCHVTSGTHSKSQMIQTISQTLRRPGFLRDIVQHLSRDEIRVLEFLLGLTCRATELQRLISDIETTILPGENWERINDILDSLMAFGLLVRQRNDNGQEEVYIPNDIHTALVTRSGKPGEDIAIHDGPVRPEPGHPFSLLEDLFDFAAYVDKNEVRFTAERRVFKRAEESIKETLSHPTAEVFLPGPQERLGLPDHWQLLVDVSEHSGLVEESEGRLRTTSLILEWIRRDRLALTRRFLDVATDLFITRVVPLSTCLRCIETVCDAHWHTVEDLEKATAEASLHPDPAGADVHAGVEWTCGLLCSLGLLQFGEGNEGQRLFRTTSRTPAVFGLEEVSSPHEEPFQVAVQPNFEIMVHATAPFEHRWELEQFADLRKRDVVLTYEITKESVYHHLKNGGDAARIMEFLKRTSPRPVPQNVEFSIHDWSDAYGAVTFLDVLVLHCRSEDIAHEIEATKSLQGYLHGKLSSTDLIVSRDGIEQVRVELNRLGYLPDPVVRRY